MASQKSGKGEGEYQIVAGAEQGIHQAQIQRMGRRKPPEGSPHKTRITGKAAVTRRMRVAHIRAHRKATQGPEALLLVVPEEGHKISR
jgi:hypothetical protein